MPQLRAGREQLRRTRRGPRPSRRRVSGRARQCQPRQGGLVCSRLQPGCAVNDAQRGLLTRPNDRSSGESFHAEDGMPIHIPRHVANELSGLSTESAAVYAIDVVEGVSNRDGFFRVARGSSNESHHTPRSDRIRRGLGHDSHIVPRGSRDRSLAYQDRQRRVHLWRDRGKRRADLRGTAVFVGDRRHQRRRDHRRRAPTSSARPITSISRAISRASFAVGAGTGGRGGRKAAELTNARGVLLKLRGRQWASCSRLTSAACTFCLR